MFYNTTVYSHIQRAKITWISCEFQKWLNGLVTLYIQSAPFPVPGLCFPKTQSGHASGQPLSELPVLDSISEVFPHFRWMPPLSHISPLKQTGIHTALVIDSQTETESKKLNFKNQTKNINVKESHQSKPQVEKRSEKENKINKSYRFILFSTHVFLCQSHGVIHS